MAVNTTRLGLLKKDPVVDGNDTFNIKTMLNDNWDALDTKVETITGAQAKADAAKSEAATDATNKANAAEANAKSASIPLVQKGATNGVATLDASTKVPLAQVPTSSMVAINDYYMTNSLGGTGSGDQIPAEYGWKQYYTLNVTRIKGREKINVSVGPNVTNSGGTNRAGMFRLYINGVLSYESGGINALIDMTPYTIGSTVTFRIDISQTDWSSSMGLTMYTSSSFKTHDIFTIL